MWSIKTLWVSCGLPPQNMLGVFCAKIRRVNFDTFRLDFLSLSDRMQKFEPIQSQKTNLRRRAQRFNIRSALFFAIVSFRTIFAIGLSDFNLNFHFQPISSPTNLSYFKLIEWKSIKEENRQWDGFARFAIDQSLHSISWRLPTLQIRSFDLKFIGRRKPTFDNDWNTSRWIETRKLLEFRSKNGKESWICRDQT